MNTININWSARPAIEGDQKSLQGSYDLNGKTYEIEIYYSESQTEKSFSLQKEQIERKIRETVAKVLPLSQELIGKEVGISFNQPTAIQEKIKGKFVPLQSSNAGLERFFNQFTKEMKSWVYIIQSSGGGGHIAAANALASKFAATKRLDVMRSFASGGSKAGEYFTGLWDEAQKKGDLAKQKKLVESQATADRMFYTTTFLQVAWDLLWSHQQLPKEVIVTQPLQLPAIIDAVQFANKRRQNLGEKIEKIHLYMTDYPKPEAVHFFGALKNISESQASKLVLHAPKPSDKDQKDGVDFWKEMTGKNLEVVYESLPVREGFTDPKLPKPGDRVEIKVKAPKGDQTYQIGEKDRVGLIMLGSQPTGEAVKAYVRSMISFANRSLDRASHHFLFVTCGKAEGDGKNPLYNDVLEMVKENKNPNVTIAPLINQDILQIFGRADLTINRTGGMSTAEILALKTNPKRPDHKKVLIHTQTPDDLVEAAKRKRAKTEEEWQRDLQKVRNEKGNPLWEAGNAEYLKEMCKQGEVEVIGTDVIDSYFRDHFFPELPAPEEKYPFDSSAAIAEEEEIEQMIHEFELVDQPQPDISELSHLFDSVKNKNDLEELLKI